MRIAACLLVLVSAAPAGTSAQEAIEWSVHRRLSKNDFKARVPPSTVNASMSAIAIDASWACERGSLVATARATFDPSLSWWRNAQGSVWSRASERTGSSHAQQEARRSGMQRDRLLLEHEQLHFDIAEVVVRKIRDQFAGFKDACGDAGDTNLIRQIVVRAERELQGEQQRYDRETRHGVDERAQDRWKRRIQALLY